MTKFVRMFLVAALAIGGGFAGTGIAAADIEDSNAANVQEGDNETRADQSGSGESGDAVGGQVVGIVSSGDASVDATNLSEDVDVETGEATGANSAASFVGLNATGDTVVAADIENVPTFSANVQEGDNDLRYSQSADAVSGDGVGGQVIGAVTSPGGSADIVAANTSRDVDITTGDADVENTLPAFVGLNVSDQLNIGQVGVAPGVQPPATPTAAQADVVNVAAFNVQEGDNDGRVDQSAGAASGDGVGGQVIGAVSAGSASIDATNLSQDVDIDTGDAEAANEAALFVGLNVANNTNIGGGVGAVEPGPPTNGTPTAVEADLDGVIAFNAQEGDNGARLSQDAAAASGDGVGGQVIGAVTSAGGSADIVAANTSVDVDIDTGDAEAFNEAAAFVGLNVSDTLAIGGGVAPAPAPPATPTAAGADITNSQAFNVQEGDNDLRGDQSADAASGDGVGGQVIGAVSAGDTSIDATNLSQDVDVDTGDAEAANARATFVGLNTSGPAAVTADINNVLAGNLQEGDNDARFSQSADASSGDAVAGQVAGVVTTAGGSAEAVLDNTSRDVDTETGDTEFNNIDAGFVGLNLSDFIIVS